MTAYEERKKAMSARIDYETRIETMCRAVAADHYAARFGKPTDDPHVQLNVDSNWQNFRGQMIIADRACLAAIEEPTEEMLNAAREMRKSYDEPADIYTAMWSAIPRGDR